jgi:RecB family exonuclease
MRCGLTQESTAAPLWFGSAFHFALEDYHGYNRFQDPSAALAAYYDATRRQHPPQASELYQLGVSMLDHYKLWLRRRNEFQTYWVGGVPQVEVSFYLPLARFGDNIYYSVTFDRVARDPHGRLWIIDYKTAQRFNTAKLETDPQVSAYMWAANYIYGEVPEGIVYMQFLKNTPHRPMRLTRGGLSVNKQQCTTYEIAYEAGLEEYGSKSAFPEPYKEFLKHLMLEESPDGDKFIRRDLVRRNAGQVSSEEWKVFHEVRDMLDPELPLYPNPTRDCSWDCPFVAPCIATDDGMDSGSIQLMLDELYIPRKDEPEWRSKIQWPEAQLPTTTPSADQLILP